VLQHVDLTSAFASALTTNSIDDRVIGSAFEPEEGKDALGITITRRSMKGGDAASYDDSAPGMVSYVELSSCLLDSFQ
jgi:hypothetical protein